MPIDYRIISTRFISMRGWGSQVDAVAAPTAAYNRMAEAWSLISDLMGGTGVMRSRGEAWLPREPNETPANYKVRLNRSFLYGAFKDTVEKTVAKPFSKPITVQEDDGLPEPLSEISEDVDRAGVDITQLGRMVFETMIAFGKAHVFIDFPNTGGTLTLGQERERKVRPLFKFVHPQDLIGWRTETTPDGEERLVQARIREFKTEPDGKYSDKEVEYIRVLNSSLPPDITADPAGEGEMPVNVATGGSWELHKRQDDGSYVMVDSGSYTYPGVPLVTFYSKRTKFMEAEPPLEDLAELNLEHYQSSSDQRNVLRFARIGMIAMTGVSQDEMDQKTTIAPNATLRSVNPEAKFYYVEHSGKAIEAGERDISHLEQKMEVLGMKPFVARSQQDTATGKQIDKGEDESNVMTWARSLENGFEECYEVAAEWVGVELPDDFKIDVFTDFSMVTGDAAQAEFLLKCRTSRELSQPTFLREIKRRGILSDDLDVDDEIDLISTEGPTFDQQLEQEKVKQMGADANNPIGDPTADPTAPEPSPFGDSGD